VADDDDWGDSRLSGNTEPPRRRRQKASGRAAAARVQLRGKEMTDEDEREDMDIESIRLPTVRRDERYHSHAREVMERQKAQREHEEAETQAEFDRMNSPESMAEQMQAYKNAEAGQKMTKPGKKTRFYAPHQSASAPKRTGSLTRTTNEESTLGVWGDDSYPVWGTEEKAAPRHATASKTQGKTKTASKTQTAAKTRSPTATRTITTYRARDAKGRFVSSTKPKGKKKPTKKVVPDGKVVGVVAGGKGARGVKTGKKVTVTGAFKGQEASDVVATSRKLEAQRAAKPRKPISKKEAKQAVASKKQLSRASAGIPKAPLPPRGAKGRFVAPAGKKQKPKVLSEKEFEKKDSEFFTQQKAKLDRGEISQETYNRYVRARKKHYLDTHPQARKEPSYHMVIKYKAKLTADYYDQDFGDQPRGSTVERYFSVAGVKKPRLTKREMKDLAIQQARKSGLVVVSAEVVLTRDEWTGIKL
jgi:hypothetical protein